MQEKGVFLINRGSGRLKRTVESFGGDEGGSSDEHNDGGTEIAGSHSGIRTPLLTSKAYQTMLFTTSGSVI